MEIHDIIVDELLQHKSIAAFIWLINQGRELEFEVDGFECFVSMHGAIKTVSLYINKMEQSFESMEDLILYAQIGKKNFLEIWSRAIIGTLY